MFEAGMVRRGCGRLFESGRGRSAMVGAGHGRLLVPRHLPVQRHLPARVARQRTAPAHRISFNNLDDKQTYTTSILLFCFDISYKKTLDIFF